MGQGRNTCSAMQIKTVVFCRPSLSLQFGVGFYSAFLVADRVHVQTKSIDEDATWVWEATTGASQFKVSQETDSTLKRGTRCVCMCVSVFFRLIYHKDRSI
jgi:hypothetical protein